MSFFQQGSQVLRDFLVVNFGSPSTETTTNGSGSLSNGSLVRPVALISEGKSFLITLSGSIV